MRRDGCDHTASGERVDWDIERRGRRAVPNVVPAARHVRRPYDMAAKDFDRKVRGGPWHRRNHAVDAARVVHGYVPRVKVVDVHIGGTLGNA